MSNHNDDTDPKGTEEPRTDHRGEPQKDRRVSAQPQFTTPQAKPDAVAPTVDTTPRSSESDQR